MYAFADHPFDLSVAVMRELDRQVRGIERSVLGLVLGQEAAFKMHPMASGAAKHVNQPLTVSDPSGFIRRQSAVERDWGGPSVAGRERKAKQCDDGLVHGRLSPCCVGE